MLLGNLDRMNKETLEGHFNAAEAFFKKLDNA
jgi:deoxyribodipyrimidine photolyase-related protein